MVESGMTEGQEHELGKPERLKKALHILLMGDEEIPLPEGVSIEEETREGLSNGKVYVRGMSAVQVSLLKLNLGLLADQYVSPEQLTFDNGHVKISGGYNSFVPFYFPDSSSHEESSLTENNVRKIETLASQVVSLNRPSIMEQSSLWQIVEGERGSTFMRPRSAEDIDAALGADAGDTPFPKFPAGDGEGAAEDRGPETAASDTTTRSPAEIVEHLAEQHEKQEAETARLFAEVATIKADIKALNKVKGDLEPEKVEAIRARVTAAQEALQANREQRAESQDMYAALKEQHADWVKGEGKADVAALHKLRTTRDEDLGRQIDALVGERRPSVLAETVRKTYDRASDITGLMGARKAGRRLNRLEKKAQQAAADANAPLADRQEPAGEPGIGDGEGVDIEDILARLRGGDAPADADRGEGAGEDDLDIPAFLRDTEVAKRARGEEEQPRSTVFTDEQRAHLEKVMKTIISGNEPLPEGVLVKFDPFDDSTIDIKATGLSTLQKNLFDVNFHTVSQYIKPSSDWTLEYDNDLAPGNRTVITIPVVNDRFLLREGERGDMHVAFVEASRGFYAEDLEEIARQVEAGERPSLRQQEQEWANDPRLAETFAALKGELFVMGQDATPKPYDVGDDPLFGSATSDTVTAAESDRPERGREDLGPAASFDADADSLLGGILGNDTVEGGSGRTASSGPEEQPQSAGEGIDDQELVKLGRDLAGLEARYESIKPDMHRLFGKVRDEINPLITIRQSNGGQFADNRIRDSYYDKVAEVQPEVLRILSEIRDIKANVNSLRDDFKLYDTPESEQLKAIGERLTKIYNKTDEASKRGKDLAKKLGIDIAETKPSQQPKGDNITSTAHREDRLKTQGRRLYRALKGLEGATIFRDTDTIIDEDNLDEKGRDPFVKFNMDMKNPSIMNFSVRDARVAGLVAESIRRLYLQTRGSAALVSAIQVKSDAPAFVSLPIDVMDHIESAIAKHPDLMLSDAPFYEHAMSLPSLRTGVVSEEGTQDSTNREKAQMMNDIAGFIQVMSDARVEKFPGSPPVAEETLEATHRSLVLRQHDGRLSRKEQRRLVPMSDVAAEIARQWQQELGVSETVDRYTFQQDLSTQRQAGPKRGWGERLRIRRPSSGPDTVRGIIEEGPNGGHDTVAGAVEENRREGPRQRGPSQ